jgi:multimeric flavodoxin WrbA
MTVKILGICGSPVKKGNTKAFLEESLRSAKTVPDVETELINLAGKKIRDCIHCNWCVRKQEEGKFCSINDDMNEIYPKIVEADALLLASPVYIGRLSGYLAACLDRLRAIVHGNLYKNCLHDKPGGALTVTWFRNSGVESTLMSMMAAFLTYKMVPVGAGMRGQWGASGASSFHGAGGFDPEDRLLVLKDEFGVDSAHILGREVATAAKLMKAGKEAIPTWNEGLYGRE